MLQSKIQECVGCLNQSELDYLKGPERTLLPNFSGLLSLDMQLVLLDNLKSKHSYLEVKIKQVLSKHPLLAKVICKW